MNGAGAGFVTKIPHLVHLRGHALQQCSMAVFNPQFQRTRYQGRHGSNSSSCNMNIQDALDLHLKEEAFRIIGKDGSSMVFGVGLPIFSTCHASQRRVQQPIRLEEFSRLASLTGCRARYPVMETLENGREELSETSF